MNAQEVRQRRMTKMREVSERNTRKAVVDVFDCILQILDEGTEYEDFTGIRIYAGDRIDKRYTIECYGFCDWLRKPNDRELISFEKAVLIWDFLEDLKNYVNSVEGFYAETREVSPNVMEIFVNIK